MAGVGVYVDKRRVAADYHQRTKHHFDRYARSAGHLDWATQPDPFRRFWGAPLIHLPFAGADHPASYDELYLNVPGEPAAFSAASIGALFEFSLALSAWKEYGGSRWALRINPSSGNLHPTEAYLLAPAADLSDQPGVYHYAPKAHGLERRTSIEPDVWEGLACGLARGTCFVGLSSIHWREAWKYGERAYRYCQHDVGHAIAAVGFSAALLGWRATWLDGLGDDDVAALLGLDRDADFASAEREHPDLLLAVTPGWVDSTPRSLPGDAIEAVARGPWVGRANRLSVSHVDWALIDEVSRACVKERTAGSTSGAGGRTSMIDSPDPAMEPARSRGGLSTSARAVIQGRRSAVAMDRRTFLTRRTFFAMLDRVMPRCGTAPWVALGPPVCVHLLLFVHRVEGVDPGLYFLARDANEMASLREAMRADFEWIAPPGCPDHLPLRRLMSGDARRVATRVSCHQEIAGDGAVAAGMIARFAPSLEARGAWFYRRLFWEAGVIGQVLYLEAEAAGVRGTGIGCYFDDAVHELLGLSGTQYQSLYHFTIGGPMDDPRLTTLPPYDPARRET
jgi:SagB-type dehydrogenase family enzyme